MSEALSHPAVQGGLASVKLPPRIEALLDRLDEDELTAPRNRRGQARLRFRRSDIVLELNHPGGGAVERRVIGRDLSAGGVSVLNDGFIYGGIAVTVTLGRRGGGHDLLKGTVRYCRLVGGGMHLVGIRFEGPIDPKLYLDPGTAAEPAEATAVNKEGMRGRVLLIGAVEADRLQFEHTLQGTGYECKSVRGAEEAAAACGGGAAWAVLVTALNFEADQKCEGAVARVRAAGFKGPVIALTADNTPSQIQSARAGGASAVLAKPYTPQQLLGLMAESLEGRGASAGENPLFSTLLTDAPARDARPAAPEVRRLVEQYVIQARRLAVALQAATASENLDLVTRICQTLKGSGDGYGFAPVTASAMRALRSLNASASVAESLAELQRLTSICSRVTAGGGEPERAAKREAKPEARPAA